jgi:dihydropteroate synthase
MGSAPGRRAPAVVCEAKGEVRSPAVAVLDTVTVGGGAPVAVMGVLNVSPESFHAGSVHRDAGALRRAAEAMVQAGAALVDVGAMSTAPYRGTAISEAEEAERLASAVAALAGTLGVPISADTARPAAARAALEAGATVVNDVSGLADPAVAELVARARVSAIVMAHPGAPVPPSPPAAAGGASAGAGSADAARAAADPVAEVLARLDGALARVRAAGIAEERIAVDPGIGFFLAEPAARCRWDVAVLAALPRLAALGRPVAVGLSRKSFLGALTGRADPADRLAGSLAATAVAVLGGAALVRTHDVRETVDAVRVAERLRDEAAW